MWELGTSHLAHQANRTALQDNIQHKSFLLSIFSWQNPQSYFLSLALTRIPFLLCNIFWGPVFSDFGYKNTCNLRQRKKKLKSQISNQSSHKVLWNKSSFQEEDPSCNHALFTLAVHQQYKKSLQKWWAWGPATCRGPLPTVYGILCSTLSAITGELSRQARQQPIRQCYIISQ